MKKILFVCTGNTCRSPMAESIMKHLLNKSKNNQIMVSSCGLSVNAGDPMNETSVLALKKLKIKPHKHSAKPFEKSFFEQYNLILTMTKAQKQMLGDHKNLFTISELTKVEEIADPYGMSLENYQITATLLLKACNVLLDTIL